MENRAERNDTEDLTEERSRFMHYYNRYQNHLESIKVCVQLSAHVFITASRSFLRLSKSYWKSQQLNLEK